MVRTRLLIGTRKGLFSLSQGNGRWALSESGFLGDPVTMVLEDPRDGTWYAALNLGHFGVKLHRSVDAGRTWEECAAPAFPVAGGEEGKSVSLLWCLEAGGPNEAGVLWAGTLPGALFKTDTRGDSWHLNEPLWNRPERKEWFGGGFDDPGIHSVCIDPRDSQRLTVGISCGGVWVSEDGGTSWHLRADGMRAGYMPPERAGEPNIQDPHRVVQCPARPEFLWAQHHDGIFRSVDASLSWQEITGVKPSAFGFAVAVHPVDPELAWFVPAIKDERRIPVDGRFVVTRTRDGGRSFEILREGLPEGNAYDLVYRHALEVATDGETLAVGSTTGSLWISENQGDSWNCLSTHLPPIYCVRFLKD